MKKAIALLFAISIFLTSCSAGNDEPKETTQTTQAQITTENEPTSPDFTTKPSADNMTANFGEYSREKVIWGPGNVIEHERPSAPVELDEKYRELDGNFILEDEKTVCLTFDEGYENGFTPKILDTLKEKNVKAIFFVTYDFAKDNPEIIKRMIDEGHTVGNHTYRHYTMDEVELSVAEEEISYLHNYMKEKHNYEMKYFRFPKGEFSEQTLYLAKTMGYKSVFWSFAYADWDIENQPSEKTALDSIMSSLHNGEIILLHAVSSANANVLPSVIDEIHKQGYNFTTNI